MSLAIEMLVLEEHHRVVAANCRPKQAVRIQRVRRHHHSNAWRVSEQHLAALAVANRAAFQVSADCNSDHHRALPSVVRAPAQHRHFIAQLVHRGRNVIEKLNLRNWLQSASRKPTGATYDVCLGQRRVEYASASKSTL